MSDLAKRAVACKHWRWMPGMSSLHPRMGPARVLRVTQQGVWVVKEESLASGFRVDEDGCVPDLTDPATLGCLLALVRKAWDDPQVHAAPLCGMKNDHVGWRVWLGRDLTLYFDGDTEAEALVAALEAAP